jgi:glycosyltransferase involved in cell wall biosynthesis
MRILLINHYAGNPELGMEYRPFYLAREWQKMGHEVLIVAASQAHVRSKQFDITNDFKEYSFDGVSYLIIQTPAYQGNGLARVKNIRAFVRSLKNMAQHLAHDFNPDVVLASSTYPLDNYPARKIAKLAGAKYVYEVHDLWPLSPKELGNMPAWHPFIIWMQAAENYAYRHADLVVSMLPKTQEHMRNHGLDLSKWHFIPNGIAVEEWEQTKELNSQTGKQINEIKSKHSFIVAYTGSFGIANALDKFIQSATYLNDEEVALVLVGDGPELSRLEQEKKKRKLNQVYILPAIAKTEIPALLSHFDALYIGLQHQPLFRFGISPNKIMDYMMAAKPIIQAIDAGNNMVEEAQCGLFIQPENPEVLAKAILKTEK